MNIDYSLTVCDELVRQGYMSKEERKREGRYCLRVVPRPVCALYLITIWPVVLLMKLVPFFTPYIAIIARVVWINKAVREG